MILLELLSRLQNSNTSLLFRNLFTGLKFQNELNIKPSDKILNTTQPLYLYDLLSIQPPHGHNTRSSPYITLIKPSSSVSHSSILPTCFTSSMEPASYNTQNSSSKLFIPSQRPLFEHAGLTCYTLLSPLITFPLFQTYLFRKSYPPP